MKYQHPTIEIQTPAPGHYVITGHNPTSTFVEGVGHVVPLLQCYISPQVPSEALLAVLEERGDLPKNEPAIITDEFALDEKEEAPKSARRPHRNSKEVGE